jgi:hypothetical protein
MTKMAIRLEMSNPAIKKISVFWDISDLKIKPVYFSIFSNLIATHKAAQKVKKIEPTASQ